MFEKDGELVEVALTRQEKSNGNGYHDFHVENIGVSIEEDLKRRDFSINSIAKHYLTGKIIDPLNGQKDIEEKIIAVTNPKSFSDDPLRLIRACRFATRYGFVIPIGEMMDNADKIVYISNDRIVAEFKKVVDEGSDFATFISLLSVTNILQYVFPDLYNLNFVCAGPEKYHGNKSAFHHTMDVVRRAQENGGNFSVIMSCLFHDIGKGITPKELVEQGKHHGHEFESYRLLKNIVVEYPFDGYTRDLMLYCAKYHMKAHVMTNMRDRKLMEFYKGIPKKFYDDFFFMCNCDHEFTEKQKLIKKKLDKMKDIVYDVDKINKCRDKQVEVINQLVRFYVSMEV